MVEIVVNLGLEKTFKQLRDQLVLRKCRIIAEEAPNRITVVQGSLWGTSPKSSQKKISYQLSQENSLTKVAGTSRLTSKYINLTLLGVALSFVLLFICAWIALDLNGYTENGFWSWLAWSSGPFGQFQPDVATLLVRVNLIFVVFLASTLVAEAIIMARVSVKKEAFTIEIFNKLR